MNEEKRESCKTWRILRMYRLFMTCEEVSKQEIRNYLDFSDHKWNDKTFTRDIKLLKQIGLPIRFSGRRKAFVLVYDKNNEDAKASDSLSTPQINKKTRIYINKILRLTKLIDFLEHVCEEDSPVEVWYRITFPDVSKRTMQRDFKTLEEVGYSILYKREWRLTPEERSIEDDDGKIWTEYEEPLGHYYFDFLTRPKWW